MDIWSILWPIDIFYGHLVNFVVIWYMFPRVGKLYQEKSGNPAGHLFEVISGRDSLTLVDFYNERFTTTLRCRIPKTEQQNVKNQAT
jgi:hypothetical protein